MIEIQVDKIIPQNSLARCVKSLELPWWLGGKESAYNAGTAGNVGLIPGSGISRGEHGYPLQSSCLENSLDRGASWAIVHRIAELDMTKVTWHTHILRVLNEFPCSDPVILPL